ncbi:membrane protein [Pilimelia terevasa]|uniref:Membrane protein n=1 Tax=Pilimelia terevasa TaxID=53372 RepID=A0A8J3BSH1_9ACTN|nr:AEC family transporter [Pilimelia terevasa]GGK30770.1 membrane protein [Pilimelia terevasa]
MVDAFALIWLLVAVGVLARRASLLDAPAERALNRFVFHLAMPAALLPRVAASGVDAGTFGAALACTAAAVAVGLAGYWASGRLAGRGTGGRTVAGMAAGYVNSANLGIPVALHVLGGTTLVVAVVAVQVLVLTPVILAVLDHAAGDGRVRWRRLATLPLRNPIIIACAAGAVLGYAGWELPALAGTFLDTLGAAAVPAALVALGLSLVAPAPPGAADRRELAAVAALKLVAHPVLTYALARYALHLPPPDVRAAVVFAALPTAQVTYVFAAEHATAVHLAGRAVAVTTAAAMLTVWLAALLV